MTTYIYYFTDPEGHIVKASTRKYDAAWWYVKQDPEYRKTLKRGVIRDDYLSRPGEEITEERLFKGTRYEGNAL